MPRENRIGEQRPRRNIDFAAATHLGMLRRRRHSLKVAAKVMDSLLKAITMEINKAQTEGNYSLEILLLSAASSNASYVPPESFRAFHNEERALVELLLRRFKPGCFHGVRARCQFTRHLPDPSEWDPHYGGSTYLLLAFDWKRTRTATKSSSLDWLEKMRVDFNTALGPPPQTSRRYAKVTALPC